MSVSLSNPGFSMNELVLILILVYPEKIDVLVLIFSPFLFSLFTSNPRPNFFLFLFFVFVSFQNQENKAQIFRLTPRQAILVMSVNLFNPGFSMNELVLIFLEKIRC